MLKEFQNKEIERWNTLLASYEADIASLVEQVAAVDEKYRKLAAEETKNLSEAVDYYQNMAEDCRAKLAVLGQPVEETEKPKRQRKAKAETQSTPEPEPEKVVDTLFPENNEPEPEEQPATEEVAEEPVEEEPVEELPETEDNAPAGEDPWAEETPDKPKEGDPIDLDWTNLVQEW